MQDPKHEPARPLTGQPPPQTARGPIPNSYWLMPGRLACGEYPGDMDGGGEYRLEALVQAGLNRFIDLTEEAEMTQYGPLRPYLGAAQTAAPESPVHCTRRAISDHQVPATRAAMTAILDDMDRALVAGENIYLHCWGGVGRTGTVAGCWLVRRGLTGDQALEYLQTLWHQVEKSRRRPTTPGNPSQTEYVRTWSEPKAHQMRAVVYDNRNPGVFTKYDALGIECCKDEELSGAFVHIATGGSALAECLACGRHWHLQNVPTHENGPVYGLTATPMPPQVLPPVLQPVLPPVLQPPPTLPEYRQQQM